MDLIVTQWKQYEWKRNIYMCSYTQFLDYDSLL